MSIVIDSNVIRKSFSLKSDDFRIGFDMNKLATYVTIFGFPITTVLFFVIIVFLVMDKTEKNYQDIF